MSSSSVKVSVIIAAYCPGDGILRVVHSLDRQTLPQDEFEVIIVDDGSPDDTFERLTALRATRGNMRITQIPNSGWPSRPRNVAMDLASGEYLLFMDHDDSLYPDALERSYRRAVATRADVLSPKESKTNDIGWGMARFTENVDNIIGATGIDGLLPMVPHKFYRRDFVERHGIRFPEGRRMLWEDIYFNVEAYRHAEVVTVLSDTPVYLWHATGANNSKTYGPKTAEFWDRLLDLFAFIQNTLDSPAYEADRVAMLLHQYRGRVLARLSRALATATPAETAMAMSYVHRIHQEYVPETLDGHLATVDRTRSVLLRAGRTDLLGALHRFDSTLAGRSTATEVSWTDAGVSIAASCTWRSRTADGPAPLRSDRGRILRNLPAEVGAALPGELVDVTDQLPTATAGLEIRSRAEHVTWSLPTSSTPSFIPRGDGTGALRVDVTAEVDLAGSGYGRISESPVWDLYSHTGWLGADKRSKVTSTLPARAALLDGRPGVAYSNTRKGLTIDLAQKLRSVAKDGRPRIAEASGDIGAFILPLGAVHVSGRTTLPSPLLLTPLTGAERQGADPDSEVPPLTLEGRLVGDEQGARVEAGGVVPAGSYRLSVPTTGGGAATTSLILDVESRGGIAFRDVPATRERAARPRISVLGRARASVRAALRRLSRRAGR